MPDIINSFRRLPPKEKGLANLSPLAESSKGGRTNVDRSGSHGRDCTGMWVWGLVAADGNPSRDHLQQKEPKPYTCAVDHESHYSQDLPFLLFCFLPKNILVTKHASVSEEVQKLACGWSVSTSLRALVRHLRTPASFMTRSISPARPGGDAPSEELGLEMLADSSDATSSTKAFTCQAQAA